MIVKLSNKYYIYLYLDIDNIPFYVGKGKNKRHKICKHLHKNNPNLFLKRKIRKVGVSDVQIQFIHKNLTEEEAFQFEIFYIELYGRRDKGEGTLCNLTDGGEGSSGYTHTDEAKRKMSDANKGKSCTKETKQKMSDAAKGRIFSNKTRKKISDTLKGENNPFYGIPRSDEIKQKMSVAMKGKKFGPMSDEHKQKISGALKGKMVGERNHRYGKSAWNKGIPMSDEIKQKIRDTKKGKVDVN